MAAEPKHVQRLTVSEAFRLLASRPSVASEPTVELTTMANGGVKPTVKAHGATVAEAGRAAEAEFDRLLKKYNGRGEK